MILIISIVTKLSVQEVLLKSIKNNDKKNKKIILKENNKYINNYININIKD